MRENGSKEKSKGEKKKSKGKWSKGGKKEKKKREEQIIILLQNTVSLLVQRFYLSRIEFCSKKLTYD